MLYKFFKKANALKKSHFSATKYSNLEYLNDFSFKIIILHDFSGLVLPYIVHAHEKPEFKS